jgi:hypothetical protein
MIIKAFCAYAESITINDDSTVDDELTFSQVHLSAIVTLCYRED